MPEHDIDWPVREGTLRFLCFRKIPQKHISAKDRKGNPTTFNLKIAFKIEVENSLGEKQLTVFEESTSYENNDNKFELKKYEDSIKKNMIESINESLILYLQNLNLADLIKSYEGSTAVF